MKVTFVGATRRKGKAKATGNPYDMCMFFYATRVESVSTANMQYYGHGFETKEMELNPEALDLFKDIKLGQEIDVLVEPKPTNPRFTWISGIAGQQARPAA
ncbi:hypothetical protein ACKC5Q_04060 [Aeromonas dhakensis]|uniref:hypothetical protein n=1 Tax=Aeromonas dhakensis TaxID=196024 RepID=UPI0038B66386